MTQIVCKDTHKRRDYKIKLHLFTFIQLINRSFACGEVREVRGKLRDKCPMFKLEDYCLLTSRTTVGSDNFFNFNKFPHLRN